MDIQQIERAEQVELLQNICIGRATGDRDEHDAEYKHLRKIVTTDPNLSPYAPSFIRICTDPRSFWTMIKGKFDTYHERRVYIYAEFSPLIEKFGGESPGILDSEITAELENFSAEGIVRDWHKALERLNSDPEGAITLARTVVESTCKHVLDDRNIEYRSNADLSELWKSTAKELNLSPEQHNEQVFKQVLSGCVSIVKGLSAVRNRLSDAHGKGRVAARPSARHASLVVGVAGSLAKFVVETERFRQSNGP